MVATGDDGDSAAAVQMKVDLAVLKEKTGSIERKIDDLSVRLSSQFVTKTELAAVADDVTALKSAQAWITKLVVGVVITAVLGLVVIKGGVR